MHPTPLPRLCAMFRASIKPNKDRKLKTGGFMWTKEQTMAHHRSDHDDMAPYIPTAPTLPQVEKRITLGTIAGLCVIGCGALMLIGLLAQVIGGGK